MSLVSNNVSFDHMKIYNIPKCNSHSKLCTVSLVIYGYICYIWRNKLLSTAYLPIYNKRVNILQKAVTMKPLFRLVSNLARLYLPTYGRFVAPDKNQNLWCRSILSQNFFFSKKSQRSTYGSNIRVSHSTTLDGKGNCISGHYLLKLEGA